MKSANESLSTFRDGDADDDRLVPFRVVLRWIKYLRAVKGVHRFAGKHLNPYGRGDWALAEEDDSITLYTVDNLIGQAILAVPVTVLARAEQRLLKVCRISPQEFADVMHSAAVYAIRPPHRTAIRFANKEAVQKRLLADTEDRRAKAIARDEALAAEANELSDGTVSPPAGSSTASPSIAVKSRPAPQKRASSALSPPPPPSPTLQPEPAAEAAAPTIVRSTALPPTKRIRPPLPGPAYSSPAVMHASASTSSVPGPARPTAVTRPPSPAAQAPPPPRPPATAATFTDAERIAAAKHVAVRAFELEALRLAHEAAAREGAGAFLALDVEAWEFDHDLLLEFGWSILEYVKDDKTGKVTSRRETQHVVVKENARRRNRKFAPDARDHFDFGRTITLPQGTIYHLLSGLFSALSANKPLFLVFHDPRMDLSALRRLGFDSAADFQSDLRRLGTSASKRDGEHGIWIVDTQALFSGWLKRKSQIGLERACKEIDLPTKRLHNAGNDARYTLDLFEHMMDRSNTPSSSSALIKTIDDRAAAAAIAKQARLETGANILREKFEQKALRT